MSTMAGKHHGRLRMMGNMATYDIRKGTSNE